MQYEIRAYDALYDTKTRRIAYWDVCSDERHKTVETRNDAAYEFIDYINPDDDAVKTAWQYAKEYGEKEIQNLAWRFSIREMAKYFGGRRDYIVCVIRQDFNKNGALVGEQCVDRCDVTITTAGDKPGEIIMQEERYEPVD